MTRRPALAILVAGGLACAPAATAAAPGPLTEPNCYNPTQSNADFEAYGPTDTSVQAGNGRITVNENEQGTMTVFKYPNPSYYNQVKYFALSRDSSGKVMAQFPNEGSFAGIRYRTPSGESFAWVRSWSATQVYLSDDTAVPVTVYQSPPNVGLTVTDIDYAVPGKDVYERQFWVDRAAGSPVTDAWLVYYENFNPVATRYPYLPITDWCLAQLSDMQAAYDAGNQALVHGWSGVDSASGQATSVAFAFGWDVPPSRHQVGMDGYEPSATPGPSDGYDQARAAPFLLGNNDSARGQVTGALETALRFNATRATARLTITGAADTAAAISTLQGARRQSFSQEQAAISADWRAWLGRARLPNTSDRRVLQVAKRSLITLRLAIAPDTGAIVASAATQGPYGEDWIRDGSFINQVLDVNGFHDEVTRHNMFYVRAQTSAANPSPVRPPGNWAMASYADGIDGAPIPYEIDETGLGIWALWSHYAYLPTDQRDAYLGRVYPAIQLAANYLVQCRDPSSGFQCLANEDDNYAPTQTMHGAESVYLGLSSAVESAHAMHNAGDEAGWRTRRDELAAAIETLYDPTTRSYAEGNNAGNAYNVVYGDGGWLLWPVALHDYTDPRMRGEAELVRVSMKTSLKATFGQYEAKALLGLAHAYQKPSPEQRADLQSTLAYMASTLTTPNGLFGESWKRLAGGRPLPVQDMPHVWEHCLFYLAALEIDGAAPYTFAAEAATAPPVAAAAPAAALPRTSAPGGHIAAIVVALMVVLLTLGTLRRAVR